MAAYSKGLLGAAALVLGSTATVIGVSSKTSWNRNNPIAKDWLNENNFSKRAKAADFESRTLDDYFGLGCHRPILGEKNFKKLYTDTNLSTVTTETESTSEKTPLPISDLFTNNNEPLLGCSTAHLKVDNNKRVYQYELALRQGDKGFEERISVHTDKIVSQLVFFEKKPQTDLSKKPEYKHLFGLYRYIKQDSTSSNSQVYKVAKPTDSGTTWSDLDLSNGTNETQARYYSFWVDDSNGKGIFDNLGIKSNDKPFSSVSKDQDGSSKFVYVGSKDAQGDLQSPSTPLVHYDLSVLNSLINKIHSRKGFWKSATEFCNSNEPSDDGRQPLPEVQRLSQYCYEIKTTASAPST